MLYFTKNNNLFLFQSDSAQNRREEFKEARVGWEWRLTIYVLFFLVWRIYEAERELLAGRMMRFSPVTGLTKQRLRLTDEPRSCPSSFTPPQRSCGIPRSHHLGVLHDSGGGVQWWAQEIPWRADSPPQTRWFSRPRAIFKRRLVSRKRHNGIHSPRSELDYPDQNPGFGNGARGSHFMSQDSRKNNWLIWRQSVKRHKTDGGFLLFLQTASRTGLNCETAWVTLQQLLNPCLCTEKRTRIRTSPFRYQYIFFTCNSWSPIHCADYARNCCVHIR